MFDSVNPFTPPHDKEKGISERKAKMAAMDMIANMLLESDLMPEAHKVELRIAVAARQLADKIMYRFCKYAVPLPIEEAEAAFPLRADALEYLQLIGIGIDSFLESHPLPETLEKAAKDKGL